jgi:ComF family protein
VAPPFAPAVAYSGCESGLRELIHPLKYNGVRPAANGVGRMLAPAVVTLEPDFPARPAALIPVPLHGSKLRRRGFHQAELIARAAMKFGAARDRLRLCAELLERTQETASQIGLAGRERRENLRGALRAAQPELVQGREALVVDDMDTTGAPVAECARVLRRAGAVKVWVATLARTLKISAQHGETRPGMRLRWA